MTGIIVGFDGSSYSQRALEWAVAEAAIRHAPLAVVTVCQAVAGYWGSAVSSPDDPVPAERARQAAHEAVGKALAALGDNRPASVTVQAVSGHPADELVAAAGDADMIVVGTRGAGGFARLLLGSVSTHLTHHAHCPVVVIPPDDRV
jgi:nucleotide-binding universal stress UspA family protein